MPVVFGKRNLNHYPLTTRAPLLDFISQTMSKYGCTHYNLPYFSMNPQWFAPYRAPLRRTRMCQCSKWNCLPGHGDVLPRHAIGMSGWSRSGNPCFVLLLAATDSGSGLERKKKALLYPIPILYSGGRDGCIFHGYATTFFRKCKVMSVFSRTYIWREETHSNEDVSLFSIG